MQIHQRISSKSFKLVFYLDMNYPQYQPPELVWNMSFQQSGQPAVNPFYAVGESFAIDDHPYPAILNNEDVPDGQYSQFCTSMLHFDESVGQEHADAPPERDHEAGEQQEPERNYHAGEEAQQPSYMPNGIVPLQENHNQQGCKPISPAFVP
jgi:hypothetical protein